MQLCFNTVKKLKSCESKDDELGDEDGDVFLNLTYLQQLLTSAQTSAEMCEWAQHMVPINRIHVRCKFFV